MAETPEQFLASANRMFREAQAHSGLNHFQTRLLLISQLVCEPCLLAHGHVVMGAVKVAIAFECAACELAENGAALADTLVMCPQCYDRAGPQICPHQVQASLSEPIELRYDAEAAMEVIKPFIENVRTPAELEEYMNAKRREAGSDQL